MEKFEYYKEALRNYAVFTGRATRAQYWYFVLFNFLISFLLGFVDGLVFGSDSSVGLLSGLYSLVMIVPSIAISTRRLHDIGKSGWWQLILLIPLVGAIILIVFLAAKGDAADNQYGKPLTPSVKVLSPKKASK